MTLPKDFCERMKELLGDEYDDFIHSYDTKINQGIRINTLKCSDTAAIASELGAQAQVEWCPDGYYIDKEKISGNHPYHAAGMFYFQEPSAMSAAEGLPLGENPHILDLCAAPGGKTTHIAAKMKNKGLLVSNEIIPKRAAILAGNVERMGLTNTIVTNESPDRLAAKFPSFFDGIIVDAPCSGEGMFRKEPQAVDAWSVEHTLSCGARQKNILDDAYKMLRCGGYIMYSTCTFSYDENEAVVQYMVEKYGMEICDIPGLSMLSPGIGSFPNIEKCRRVFPHKHDGEGHFTALLRRTQEDGSPCVPKKKKIKKTVNTALSDAIKSYREFEKKALNHQCEGEFALFGDNLYLLPESVDISGIKILRCGLHLGTVKRGRFEPSHALSHAFAADAYKNVIALDTVSDELKKYMHGEVINADTNGWCVIAVNNCGIGWGKASGGIVKNHYPKALRILG
ncbi:MAG: RsmF rRNA methyltransferase first C-terminal domain-containing protein [Oscillospiraceae bacterium]|nr:RsmF rRNA methyltransferase first C-terminal domain-containing protein [Oscillospiraceae bacterium]